MTIAISELPFACVNTSIQAKPLYESVFPYSYFDANEIIFTMTRFETETQGTSVMAYFTL